MDLIKVFECPFRDECYEEKITSWIENEPLEIIIPAKCKAPFLMSRETGATICSIVVEKEKKYNWIESIKSIGRRKVGKR